MELVKNCTEDINDNNNQSKIIRKVCNEINLNITPEEEQIYILLNCFFTQFTQDFIQFRF